ncbi:MAG: nitroreductase family protein, partial [Duganella sp.]
MSRVAPPVGGRSGGRPDRPLDPQLEQILELARWAPSGDNTQPWRLQIHDAPRLVVQGHHTRDQCVNDIDRQPSHQSIG